MSPPQEQSRRALRDLVERESTAGAIPPAGPVHRAHDQQPDKLRVARHVTGALEVVDHRLFGVLPGHTPLLASLAVGELWYRKGAEKTYLSIAFGFAEVLPDRVTILARLAERAEDIDVGRAETARTRAQERLDQPKPDIDYERARIALMKSLTRLQVAARVPGGMRVGGLKRMRETRA